MRRQISQPTAAAAITISLDSTFIRSREEGERHLEVRVGNVETVDGGRQVFAAVAKTDTDIAALIRREPGNRGTNRQDRGDRFYRWLSGSARVF